MFLSALFVSFGFICGLMQYTCLRSLSMLISAIRNQDAFFKDSHEN